MTKNHIKYRKGYKYQLAEDYSVQTDIRPASRIETRYIILTPDGWLTICAGYAWDGASGPTWDDDSNMRGSVGHDALYQLIRVGLLSADHKRAADELLRRWCIEDGMWSVRADAWFWAVDRFGGANVKPSSARETLIAPKKHAAVVAA